MNTRTYAAVLVLASLAAAPTVASDISSYNDIVGDATTRRTDSGADGSLPVGVNLPDIRTLSLYGWLPTDPLADPYSGVVVPPASAHIVRIDLVLQGLINPPGPLGANGKDYEPTLFGPSPLFGFVEFDVDNNHNTGGDLAGTARNRYLANIARFGALPPAPQASRTVIWGTQADASYATHPQFERSGSDFAITLCGCDTPELVSQTGNDDSVMDPGETFIIRGRFFERATGYRNASAMQGGSDFGLYDPVVELRFEHSIESNRTTVSLVFPLTMFGASLLTGQPVQPVDTIIGSDNHASIVEALADIIAAANGEYGPLFGIERDLTQGWNGRDPADYLNPLQWSARAIVATAYDEQDISGALFVWTDEGFSDLREDVNGDSVVNEDDRLAIVDAILLYDGQFEDIDGAINGSVQIFNHSANFTIFDVNADGFINLQDVQDTGPDCPQDWDQNGVINSNDFGLFLTDYFADIKAGSTNADFDQNGVTTPADVGAYLSAYLGSGCP